MKCRLHEADPLLVLTKYMHNLLMQIKIGMGYTQTREVKNFTALIQVREHW